MIIENKVSECLPEASFKLEDALGDFLTIKPIAGKSGKFLLSVAPGDVPEDEQDLSLTSADLAAFVEWGQQMLAVISKIRAKTEAAE